MQRDICCVLSSSNNRHACIASSKIDAEALYEMSLTKIVVLSFPLFEFDAERWQFLIYCLIHDEARFSLANIYEKLDT